MPFKRLRAQYLILFVISIFFSSTSFYGSAKINIDAQDDSGKTALHNAAINGDETKVRDLLKQDANTEATDSDNCTPLHYAVDSNHESIVKILLEHKANANAIDVDKTTPAHTAAQKGFIDIAKMLKQHGADFNAKDKNDDTPLIFATMNMHRNMVRFIVSNLPNKSISSKVANTQNIDGNTALHFATSINLNIPEHAEMAQIASILIKFGADANIQNTNHESPLYLAAKESNRKLLIDLLAHDIAARNKPNYTIKYGNSTPLHHACNQLNNLAIDVILECLDKHFTPETVRNYLNIQDTEGNTALHYIINKQCPIIAKELLKRGPNPNIQNNDGKTPLHYAADNQQYDLEQIFIEYNAKINIPDNNGITPLQIVMNYFNSQLIEHWSDAIAWQNDQKLMYLAHYLDDNTILGATDSNGRTALHIAAIKNNIFLTKRLLEKKANVNAQDINRKTPLHFAAQNKHYILEQQLIDHGAKIDIPDANAETPLQIVTHHLHSQLIEHWGDAFARQDDAKLLYLAHYLDDNTLLGTTNSNGQTALHVASRKKNKPLIKFLIQHGALNLPDNQAQKPTDLITDSTEIKDFITDQLLKKHLPRNLFGFAQEKLYEIYQHSDPNIFELDGILATDRTTGKKITLPTSGITKKIQQPFFAIGLLDTRPHNATTASPNPQDNDDRTKALAIMQGKQKSKL